MIKFSIPFFLRFRTQQVLPSYLSIYYEHYNARFLDLYFREFSAAINFLGSKNWRIWRHFLKNTARIEIIIRINVENCTNTGAKVFVLLRANCCNCYYNFISCGIFEKMTSFTLIFNQKLEQGKLMAALNSRK